MFTTVVGNVAIFRCFSCSVYGIDYRCLSANSRCLGLSKGLSRSSAFGGWESEVTYRGNPQPSFLGVITHILGPKTFISSWFWGPKVVCHFKNPQFVQETWHMDDHGWNQIRRRRPCGLLDSECIRFIYLNIYFGNFGVANPVTVGKWYNLPII